ncbi:MAG: DsrE family protein [Erysipelothrix sp.]
MNVIFHLSESVRFDHCYANIINLIKLQSDVEAIELLVNGEAINLLRHGNNDRISKLIPSVNVVACNNAMVAHHISGEDLVEGVKVVPAGVYELIKKQNEGFAYIKP